MATVATVYSIEAKERTPEMVIGLEEEEADGSITTLLMGSH